MLEAFKSLGNTFVNRIRNPFGGTFLLIWVAYHWRLIFSLFNFDSRHTLSDKIKIIESYYDTSKSWDLVWFPVLLTFLSIILYLIFQHISLAIFTFFDRWVKPIVLKTVDKNQIIAKSDFEKVELEASEYQKKLKEIKDENYKLVIENEKTEKQNQDLNYQLTKQIRMFDEFKSENIIYHLRFKNDFSRGRTFDTWNETYDSPPNFRVSTFSDQLVLENFDENEKLKSGNFGVDIDLDYQIIDNSDYKVVLNAKASEGASIQFSLNTSDLNGGGLTTQAPMLLSKNYSEFYQTFSSKLAKGLRIKLIAHHPGIGQIFIRDLKIYKS